MLQRLGLAVALLLLGGCGGLPTQEDRDLPDEITGDQVARMAETHLEAKHPGLAQGTMTCPDLPLAVGEEVRCERISETEDGRRLTERGTVTVTGTDRGGRLHVRLDDELVEYGIAPSGLAADVGAQVLRRTGRAARKVSCPYLAGRVGARVRCVVALADERVRVGVVVTRCDDENRTAHYRLEWPRALRQRSLAFVAPTPSTVVD